MSRLPALLAALAMCAALVVSPRAASASTTSRGGYWFVDLAGGLDLPMGDTELRYRRALGAGLRIGRTAKSGIGIAALASYSPMTREDVGELAHDNHFVTLAAVPRFTLGRDTFRFWVGAGGGVFLERVTLRPDDAPAVSDTRFEVAAVGEAALELHLFDSAGVAFGGSYRQSFGEFETALLELGGALVFTFE